MSRFIHLTENSPEGSRRMAIDPRMIMSVTQKPATELTRIETHSGNYWHVEESYDKVVELIENHAQEHE